MRIDGADVQRKDVLDGAAAAVLQDRNIEHGAPEDTFRAISMLWEAYLGVSVSETDVAMLMVLLKVARAQQNPLNNDNFVDIAGYAACGAELVSVGV